MFGSTYRARSRSPYRDSDGAYRHSHSRSRSPGRTYDMVGGWGADSLSPTGSYGDEYYNPNAYDYDLYSPYYRVEDDYYGAYGDLLEYEENLRLAEHLSEAERLRRWQDRLEFEELVESERTRRYELMAEEERLRLGLIGTSWWARRYNSSHSHSGLGGWKNHYGNRLRRWSSNRLPLSSSLTSRFEGIWYNPNSFTQRTRRLSSVGLNPNLERLSQEQIWLNEQLHATREEARFRELEIEQSRRRIESEIIFERERAESIYRSQQAQQAQVERDIIDRNRLEQDVYREKYRRYENERNRVELERARLQNEQLRQEAVLNLQSHEQELRLRREIERTGNGLYHY